MFADFSLTPSRNGGGLGDLGSDSGSDADLEAELLRQLEDVDVDSGDDSDDGVGHGATFAARTYNALSAAEQSPNNMAGGLDKLIHSTAALTLEQAMQQTASTPAAPAAAQGAAWCEYVRAVETEQELLQSFQDNLRAITAETVEGIGSVAVNGDAPRVHSVQGAEESKGLPDQESGDSAEGDAVAVAGTTQAAEAAASAQQEQDTAESLDSEVEPEDPHSVGAAARRALDTMLSHVRQREASMHDAAKGIAEKKDKNDEAIQQAARHKEEAILARQAAVARQRAEVQARQERLRQAHLEEMARIQDELKAQRLAWEAAEREREAARARHERQQLERRQTRAATRIQAAARGSASRHRYRQQRQGVIGLQKVGRGALARRRAAKLRQLREARLAAAARRRAQTERERQELEAKRRAELEAERQRVEALERERQARLAAARRRKLEEERRAKAEADRAAALAQAEEEARQAQAAQRLAEARQREAEATQRRKNRRRLRGVDAVVPSPTHHRKSSMPPPPPQSSACGVALVKPAVAAAALPRSVPFEAPSVAPRQAALRVETATYGRLRTARVASLVQEFCLQRSRRGEWARTFGPSQRHGGDGVRTSGFGRPPSLSSLRRSGDGVLHSGGSVTGKCSDDTDVDASLETVDVSVESLSAVDALSLQLHGRGDAAEAGPELHPVGVLCLDVNKLTSLQDLGTIPACRHIRDLSANDNLVSSLAGLGSALPHLRSLSVDMNQLQRLDDIYTSNGAAKSRLRKLSAKHNKVSSLETISAASGFGHLVELALYRNALAGVLPRWCLPGLTLLQRLDLGRNKLESVEGLDSCPLLRSVTLYENQLVSMPKLRNVVLKELWLNGNNISSLQAEEPLPLRTAGDLAPVDARLGWCPLATSLHLHDNQISSLGCLRQFPMLTTLSLQFNQIEDLGELRHLRALRHLTTITLNDNPVAESAGYRLELLKHVPSLRSIDGIPVKSEDVFAARSADTANRVSLVLPWLHAVTTGCGTGTGAVHDAAVGMRRRLPCATSDPDERVAVAASFVDQVVRYHEWEGYCDLLGWKATASREQTRPSTASQQRGRSASPMARPGTADAASGRSSVHGAQWLLCELGFQWRCDAQRWEQTRLDRVLRRKARSSRRPVAVGNGVRRSKTAWSLRQADASAVAVSQLLLRQVDEHREFCRQMSDSAGDASLWPECHAMDARYAADRRTHVGTRAAVAIQARWRGARVRTTLQSGKAFNNACRTIQAVWRGHRTRVSPSNKLVAHRRLQNAAAVRIQAVARGKTVRTAVQNAIRGARFHDDDPLYDYDAVGDVDAFLSTLVHANDDAGAMEVTYPTAAAPGIQAPYGQPPVPVGDKALHNPSLTRPLSHGGSDAASVQSGGMWELSSVHTSSTFRDETEGIPSAPSAVESASRRPLSGQRYLQAAPQSVAYHNPLDAPWGQHNAAALAMPVGAGAHHAPAAVPIRPPPQRFSNATPPSYGDRQPPHAYAAVPKRVNEYDQRIRAAQQLARTGSQAAKSPPRHAGVSVVAKDRVNHAHKQRRRGKGATRRKKVPAWALTKDQTAGSNGGDLQSFSSEAPNNKLARTLGSDQARRIPRSPRRHGAPQPSLQSPHHSHRRVRLAHSPVHTERNVLSSSGDQSVPRGVTRSTNPDLPPLGRQGGYSYR